MSSRAESLILSKIALALEPPCVNLKGLGFALAL